MPHILLRYSLGAFNSAKHPKELNWRPFWELSLMCLGLIQLSVLHVLRLNQQIWR